MTPAIPLSSIELEAQGITLDKQMPVGAVIGDVTIADAASHSTPASGNVPRITLTTTTMLPAKGVGERGVVLLTPGFTSSKETFYPIMGLLAERGYRTITFSQRGQPGSSGPATPDGYPLDVLGADILALLDGLGLDSTPIHLLGHSFGGVVATAAVLAQPTRFASLTLWNSGPKKMEDNFAAVIDALRVHGPRSLWVKARMDEGRDTEADLNGTLDDVEQYYFNRLMAAEPAQLEAALNILATQPDRTPELAALRAEQGLPILISHGAQDDAWPIDWQREMAVALNAEYWVIAQAGHSAHADRSFLSAQLLATFWDTAS
jgi:pimeloyl-ACP methyl ester carboxylesterase